MSVYKVLYVPSFCLFYLSLLSRYPHFMHTEACTGDMEARVLNIACTNAGNGKRLVFVNMRWCGLDASSAGRIASGLWGHSCLLKLDLCNNVMKSVGCMAVLEAASSMPVLQELNRQLTTPPSFLTHHRRWLKRSSFPRADHMLVRK